MKRVIEILNLISVDLRNQVFDLSIRNMTLNSIVEECKDSFEVKLLKEDIKDNTEIIKDSKIDLLEIEYAIEVLLDNTKNKKRP